MSTKRTGPTMAESETEAGGKKIAVIETFGPTIQGEGPLAGSKTMFVRFGGCDYRCTKCDSLHAVIPAAVKANASYLTAEEIADRIIPGAKASGTPWVTLSGGNPCMWDLSRLIHLLHGAGLGVAVETQGTLAPDWLRLCQMVVISPKSPGMGEKFEPEKLVKFLQATLPKKPHLPKPAVALKVVVFSQQDIDFAIDVTEVAARVPDAVTPGMLFLSLGNHAPPLLEGTELVTETPPDFRLQLLQQYRILAEEVAEDPRITHFRILPQLHVLAWANESEK